LGIEGCIGTEQWSWPIMRMAVDYPAKGPEDIYAVGVPRDAKIVDKTPSTEVLALVDKIERAAEAEPKQMCEYSVELSEKFRQPYPPWFGVSVEVRYVKGDFVRRHRYRGIPTKGNEQWLTELQAFREAILDGGLKALEAWLAERKPVQILFANTTAGGTTIFALDATGTLERTELSMPPIVTQELARPRRRPLLPLGGVTELASESTGQWGKLVGFGGMYFNPQRDYLCEKQGAEGDGTRVLEYAKTDGGRWYAKLERESTYNGRDTTLVINFRDDNRLIEPEKFDETRITSQDLSAGVTASDK
jgi:hypothetical protein